MNHLYPPYPPQDPFNSQSTYPSSGQSLPVQLFAFSGAPHAQTPISSNAPTYIQALKSLIEAMVYRSHQSRAPIVQTRAGLGFYVARIMCQDEGRMIGHGVYGTTEEKAVWNLMMELRNQEEWATGPSRSPQGALNEA
ncbi:hypothetical protein EJ05DRAFT_509895 [Pseudovirgaria hyperparasitica]|uniref:Uncharacterized protein n=1 Tax=Pseudovirgaria hyperparasitica TaxID=470096 RepID=A0A6A6WB14_9PEZI|nr:uncharacterized protein EJ05DRAFT_509895 [Pseudovirgaria hyperparasitica]KAF2759026.1 hypothetical protein EJ05DRAFT_509895 [Pseudovirgaria hyperparasitica]